MKQIKRKGLLYMILLLVTLISVSSWSGPPPAEIVFYGYVSVNGSSVTPGTSLQILANGNTLVMDSDTTIAGGYYPELKLIWDDPDTGGDEGITFTNNAEDITFKINGVNTNYPASITVTTGQAGQAIELNLSFIYNFPPLLGFITNQTVLEDTLLTFNINATDNGSYRNDTLSFSDNGAPTSLLAAVKIDPITNKWQTNASWTPTNSNVGVTLVNISVTDDGLPSKSDSQLFNITVINVNDPPFISVSDQTAFVGKNFLLDISTLSGDVDPTGDTLNFTDNSSLFVIDLNTGLINLTANENQTGSEIINLTVCDDNGACTSDSFTLTILEIEGVVLVKNIRFDSETTTDVTYLIDLKVFNFIGSNITNMSIIDTDTAINITINLSDENFFENTSSVTVSKAVSNALFTFSGAVATANGTFESNIPSILVPATTSVAAAAAPIIIQGGGGGGGGGSRGCQAEWECNDWGACINGKHNRTCIDKFNCEELAKVGVPVIQTVKPQETRTCTPGALPEVTKPDRGGRGVVCVDNVDCKEGLFCWNGECTEPKEPIVEEPRLIEKKIIIFPFYLLLIILLLLWIWYKWYTITHLELVYRQDKKMIWKYKNDYFRIAILDMKSLLMVLEITKEKIKPHKEKTILTKLRKRIGFAVRCKEVYREPITTTILLTSLKWRVKHEIKEHKKNTPK